MADERVEIKLHFPNGHLGASAGDDAISLIVRALSLKHANDGEWADKYGTDYEDDVIMIHHDLQDYDCSCHVEPAVKAWEAANPHSPDCFVVIVGALVSEIEALHPLPEYDFFTSMDDYDAARFAEFWGGGKGPTAEQKASHAKKEAEREAQRLAYCKASDVLKAATIKAVLKKSKELKVAIDRKYPEWSWQYKCTCGRQARHEEMECGQEHVKPCDHWWGGQPNFLHKPSGFELRWYKYIGRDMEMNMEPPRELLDLVSESEIQAVMQNGEKHHKSFASMIEYANKKMSDAGGGGLDNGK